MLGTKDTISVTYPIKLDFSNDVCDIGGGCFQSLAVDTNGNIWTMGDNPSGQQGQGNTNRIFTPTKISFDELLNGGQQERPQTNDSLVHELPQASENMNSHLIILIFSLSINAILVMVYLRSRKHN